MCYHKQQRESLEDVANYYSASYAKVLAEIYQVQFYENGYDFKPCPVITADRPKELQLFTWGFVPPRSADLNEAIKLRKGNLNCISEEMFEKWSFKDAIAEGKRCLIPCTGFFEWRHVAKSKYPHFIYLRNQVLFSLAGIYSEWTDPRTGKELKTYTVLTTKANALMEKVHNSKMRMPVIIPREYERDWLSSNLSKEDVLAMCSPLANEMMDAYTISKMLTDRNAERNVKEVFARFEYSELIKFDSQGNIFG